MEDGRDCASCVYFDEDERGERCLLKDMLAMCCGRACPEWLEYDEGELPF